MNVPFLVHCLMKNAAASSQEQMIAWTTMGLFCRLRLFTAFVHQKMQNMELFWCVCANMAVVAKLLRISDNLAGVTILAFGNGAPDVFTALSGQEDGHSEVLFAAVSGGCLCVSVLVSGCILLQRPFAIEGWPFLRDVIYFLGSFLYLFYVFHRGTMKIMDGIVFMIIYISYITIIGILVAVEYFVDKEYEKKKSEIALQELISALGPKKSAVFPGTHTSITTERQATRRSTTFTMGKEIAKYQEEKFQLNKEFGTSRIAETHAVDNDIPGNVFYECKYFTQNFKKEMGLPPMNPWTWSGSWQNVMNVLLHPVVFVLRLIIPLVNVTSERDGWCKLLVMLNCVTFPSIILIFTVGYDADILGFMIWPFTIAIGGVMAAIVFFTTSAYFKPVGHEIFAIFGLVVATILINSLTGSIVDCIRTLGAWFGVSNSTMGFTILSWGNSIGDMVSNLCLARQGYQRMAFAACFGGPLFNCVFGTGLAIIVSMLKTNIYSVKANFGSKGVTGSFFLITGLVTTLVLVPMLNMEGRRCVGRYLIILYITFLILMILMELNILHEL